MEHVVLLSYTYFANVQILKKIILCLVISIIIITA